MVLFSKFLFAFELELNHSEFRNCNCTDTCLVGMPLWSSFSTDYFCHTFTHTHCTHTVVVISICHTVHTYVHCTGTSTVAVVVHSNCPYTQEQSLYTLYNRRRHTRHRSSYPAATVIHSNCPYTQESNRYIHLQQEAPYTAYVVITSSYCFTQQLSL